ncbi:hypothetical protein [Brevundimonas sp. PAMC22021]|uniref:hypothetical protein n=1 Tax=Brevundimonas sp. PAMC22021 TaxID=2861285 RepID=UPI001C635348|nr:hypothetical protein [Brevundimonas sp. PAMC22021]QYF87819.1 hypothetical protein KY493_04825 [Brevundimonas sp. PAMC22021]
MIRSAAVFAAVLLASGAAVGQDGSGVAITQTNPTRPGSSDAARAAQVGAPAAPLPQAEPRPRDRTVSGSTPPADGPVPYTQVTGERGQAYSRLDLATGRPSAEAPASPARRAEGRNTSTVVPTGPDRCDPQNAQALAACARVIETRAGDFPAPNPEPLSPEQRLLATQNEQRTAPNDLGAAARRLANGEVDGSNAALAVASMALNRPAPDEEDAETPALDAATQAIVAGVIGVIGAGAPVTPN